MKLYQSIFIFCFFYFCVSPLFSQNENSISYRDSLNRTALDSIDAENWIAAEKLLNSIELLSIQAKDSTNLALSYHNRGILNYYKNEYLIAKSFFQKAYKIRIQIQDSLGIASSVSNIGVVSLERGNYVDAIARYYTALRIYEALNDSGGIARTYTNIGTIYFYKGNKQKALEQYQSSLRIDILRKDDYSIAEDYQNIGLILAAKAANDSSVVLFDSSMTLYTKAIELYQKGKNNLEIASVYIEQGGLSEDFGKHSEATNYFKKSLEINKKLNNRFGLVDAYINIGEVYLQQKKLNKAQLNFEKATSICEEIGMLDMLKTCYKSLSEVYRLLNLQDKAFANLLKYISIKDTLLNEHNSTVLADMDAKYQSEKKEHMIDKLEKENAIKDAKAFKNTMFLLAMTIVLILSFVFAFFIFKSFKKQKKAKELIQKQSKELTIQKELVEKKSQEVLDSISYAKQIQTALLNSEEQLSQFLSNYFVLFKPQSIVSGDFYWAEKFENRQLFTVADCTGHGVPGGFMSMIGIILLNEIFNSKKLYSPAEILTELNRLLIISLQRYEETAVKDGMDMAFCTLDYLPKKNTNNAIANLLYAGANNSLYVVRKSVNTPFIVNEKETEESVLMGTVRLLEIKADRFAIGYDLESSKFTNHTIEMHKNDMIYLFSDGYADQFGGKKGKKLKYNTFKKQLIEVSNSSEKEQKKILDNAFINWKGNYRQIDDVCILGVRI